MKIKALLFSLLSIFLIIGCVNTVDESDNGKDTTNNDDTQVEQQDWPGADPTNVERFPGSIRRNHVSGVFSIYIAEASIEEVIAFYREATEDLGYYFFYEVVPEDHPHWVTVFYNEENTVDVFLGFTLGEHEDLDGYVEWVLYSSYWD